MIIFYNFYFFPDITGWYVVRGQCFHCESQETGNQGRGVNLGGENEEMAGFLSDLRENYDGEEEERRE